MRSAVLILLALSVHPDVIAGEADVIDVEANCDAESGCDFHVTVMTWLPG